MPDNFKKWVEDNRKRIEKAEEKGKLPYFLKDNSKYWKEKITLDKIKSPTIKTVEDLNKYFSDIADKTGWFERGFKEIRTERSKYNNGSTDNNGTIWLKKNIKEDCIKAINKLLNQKDIEESEAKSLATLWHEITHNRNKIVNVHRTKAQTFYMELANEFVARNTLNEFYGEFGVKNPFPQFETDRGNTGYNGMVKNYQLAIEKVGLAKNDVIEKVKKHLFEESYTLQKEGLQNALTGAKKLDGTKFSKSEISAIVYESLKLREYDFEIYINRIISQ